MYEYTCTHAYRCRLLVKQTGEGGREQGGIYIGSKGGQVMKGKTPALWMDVRVGRGGLHVYLYSNSCIQSSDETPSNGVQASTICMNNAKAIAIVRWGGCEEEKGGQVMKGKTPALWMDVRVGRGGLFLCSWFLPSYVWLRGSTGSNATLYWHVVATESNALYNYGIMPHIHTHTHTHESYITMSTSQTLELRGKCSTVYHPGETETDIKLNALNAGSNQPRSLCVHAGWWPPRREPRRTERATRRRLEAKEETLPDTTWQREKGTVPETKHDTGWSG